MKITREEKILKQLRLNVAENADLMRGMNKHRLCKCSKCYPTFIKKVYDIAIENNMSIRVYLEGVN